MPLCARVVLLTLTMYTASPAEIAAMSFAQPQPHSRILLHCPQALPDRAVLCDALEDSLRDAAPDADVRRIADGHSLPLGADDLGVILRISTLSADAIAGHLDTRQGSSADWIAGPELRSDVMDTTFSPALYRAFTDELVRTSVTDN